MMNLRTKIANLKGPILVIGSSGFVGANILRALLAERDDVVGTVFTGNSWRLHGIPAKNTAFLNTQDIQSVIKIFSRVSPKTIFDCASFGAYSFEEDIERIHSTNYLCFIRIMELVSDYDLAAYVHAGSSSEYGINAEAPREDDLLVPNSAYAVSKAAASHAITYYGKVRGVPVVNLRLYSVYGPYEDSSRLIPVLCQFSLDNRLPSLARPETSRDFVYVTDVVEAFIDAALAISEAVSGESFNIGTGTKTSLEDVAQLMRKLFGISVEPVFDRSKARLWDVDNWYSNSGKAKQVLGWESKVNLSEGLLLTREWWRDILEHSPHEVMTKKASSRKEKNSISAIVACYKDEQAIPIMHSRLVSVFNSLGLDYEIIFVNDNSPDNSAEVIRKISASDPSVIGITHSRNFGSQAAFRSGMELASKEACVLLDGDLQDPPEIITEFVKKWRDGADVVYGRRVKREMPRWLELLYRSFYAVFSALSEFPVPRDAGDFSLLDRAVVHWMLECRERDVFLRGLRAYVGFCQEGVDYIRPERMFGVSTNNWIKNIGWAKKAIFSYSRMPLHMLTAIGGIACLGTVLLSVASILIRLFDPASVPKGITFISLLVMFFGSITILGIGLLGEYIGKILEETKARPPFIRRDIIVHGVVKPADIGNSQRHNQ